MRNSLKIHFPELVNASPDPVLITDSKTQIIYVNPAWQNLTGYSFKEGKGKNPRFLQSGKTPKRIYKMLWKKLVKGKSFYTDEVIDKKKDGREYQTFSTYFPIQRGNKNIFYVQIQHDVTKQKLEEQRRKEFLSQASHELKTPVTTLKLLSQVISRKLKGKKINLAEVAVMERELNYLTNLINELLNLSQIEIGKVHLNLEKIDLAKLIREVTGRMKFLINRQKISIEIFRSLEVLADKYRLEQVLINLLTNASKYSPGKSVITVSLEKKGKYAYVSVADYGEGIPASKLPLLFDKYYQANLKKIGFGLGLYISKGIILRHKGKIWAESKLGKGSTFYFSLPLI